jgi:hypothetical protein
LGFDSAGVLPWLTQAYTRMRAAAHFHQD